MSSYTEGIILKKIPGTIFWAVHQSFFYDIGTKHSGVRVHVPFQFKTDGLSVPWFLTWMLSRFGPYIKAGVIHDSLYANPVIHVNGKPAKITRSYADFVFYEALLVLGYNRYKANVAYWLLRGFGWIAWRKHRKNS